MLAYLGVALLMVVGLEAHPMNNMYGMGHMMGTRGRMQGNYMGHMNWQGMMGHGQQQMGHGQQMGGYGQQGGYGQTGGMNNYGHHQQQTPVMAMFHAMMSMMQQMMMMKMGGGKQHGSESASAEHSDTSSSEDSSSEEDKDGKKDVYDMMKNMVDIEGLMKGAIMKELHEGLMQYHEMKKKEEEFAEAMRYLCLSVWAVHAHANETGKDLYASNMTEAEIQSERKRAQGMSDEALMKELKAWLVADEKAFESSFFLFSSWSCHAGNEFKEAYMEMQDKKDKKCDDRR